MRYDVSHCKIVALLLLDHGHDGETRGQPFVIVVVVARSQFEICLLLQLDSFAEGKSQFLAPVYCCWGNHEDNHVLNDLLSHKLNIHNLHMVTENEYVIV